MTLALLLLGLTVGGRAVGAEPAAEPASGTNPSQPIFVGPIPDGGTKWAGPGHPRFLQIHRVHAGMELSTRLYYVGRVAIRSPHVRGRSPPATLSSARYLRRRLWDELEHRGIPMAFGLGVTDQRDALTYDHATPSTRADHDTFLASRLSSASPWFEDMDAMVRPVPPAPWLDTLGWGVPPARTDERVALTPEGLTPLGVVMGGGAVVNFSAWVVLPGCDDPADSGSIATYWLPRALREDGGLGLVNTRVVVQPIAPATKEALCRDPETDAPGLPLLVLQLADLALADTLAPGVRAFPPLPTEPAP